MALTGELSDLSLAELIEFFCNQRKTGCIEVKYKTGSAAFFLQSGAVVHAEVGALRGIEAVYYALTQTNASFTFNSTVEPASHTINQPWTSVVLEGLRRMDEGIAPPSPFPDGVPQPIQEPVAEQSIAAVVEEVVKEQPLEFEPANMFDAQPPLVSAFDEPQAELIHVLTEETESMVSAPKEVPPVEVPIIEAYPKPIIGVRQEVAKVSAPVVEAKPKPVVSNPKPAAANPTPVAPAPKPAAPTFTPAPPVHKPAARAPVMHQETQTAAVAAEKKPKVEKKQKPVGSNGFDVEPAGILSYHPKAAPPKVSPIFAESASSGFSFGPWKLGAVFAAVVLLIAVVAVPWGWYARSKAAKLSSESQNVTSNAPQPPVAVNSTQESQASTQSQPLASDQPATVSETSNSTASNATSAESNAQKTTPKEAKPKAKNNETALASQPSATSSSQSAQTPAANASRKVTVQVTYDENGRVTQASGGDATALRIARQKRFPAGKAGSTTITIPIN